MLQIVFFLGILTIVFHKIGEKYMKKSLIVTAMLASLSSVAFAQSSVSIYGIVDAGINSTSNGVNRTTGIDSGLQSGSRLGFRGNESLGNGLSASFALETGINADTGGFGQGNTAFGRQAWVGLNSDTLGSAKLGLQYTPLRQAVDAVDPFNIGLAGNALKTLGNGTYQERIKNSVTYTTPNYSGLSGQVAYGFGEVAGSTSSNRTVGLGVNYDLGNASVRAAYNNLNGNGTLNSPDTRDVFIGGTYNFGFVKAHAAFADRKVDTNAAIASNVKTRNYLLGASVPFGPHTVMASYIRSDVRNVGNADSNQYAIGYAYAMSKRTNLYTSYGRYTNDSAVSLNVATPGATGSQFNAGVRHIF
jgi:predicted porin